MKLLLFLLAYSCSAQTVGGHLQGSVTDPSGAAVIRAAVEILHVETADLRRLIADDEGRWQDPVVPPGEYEIKVVARGFQTAIRKGIQVSVGQEIVLATRLEVGRNNTTVTVTSEAPAINTTSGAVTGLVDRRQMRKLYENA